jgi:glutathionylspermidine synthase
MKRHTIQPRPDWRQKVESQGLLFHTTDDDVYWDESAYYEFTSAEIDAVEKATYELNDMCLKAIDHVIEKNLFDRFRIRTDWIPYIVNSWNQDEITIYGRFDFVFDGTNPPQLFEYNADTPTGLLEASVIQWHWLQDFADRPGGWDQFNSIHERLIEAWQRLRQRIPGKLYFSCHADELEDYITTNYLRDTAIQAGFDTDFIRMDAIGWNSQTRRFVDEQSNTISTMFKLYPWEWMAEEEFGQYLPATGTICLEPPWKMLLSNKALLPVLYEMFPSSPYLLRADFIPFGNNYVQKPIHAREGSNITVVKDGMTIQETDGPYAGSPCIYQEYRPLPSFDGRYPVIGSWIVNGYACGIGIREDDSIITTNTSRFIPHLFC